MITPEEAAAALEKFNFEYLQTQRDLVHIGSIGLLLTTFFSTLFFCIYKKQNQIAEKQAQLSKELLILNAKLVENDNNREKRLADEKIVATIKTAFRPFLNNSNAQLQQAAKDIIVLYPNSESLMLRAFNELAFECEGRTCTVFQFKSALNNVDINLFDLKN